MNLTPQELQCLNMFRDNGNIVTTGMFLKSTLSAEYRKIISNLRKKGFEIPAPILNRDEPGKNQYTLIEGKINYPIEPITQVNDLSKNSPEKCQACGSYFKRGKYCNKC